MSHREPHPLSEGVPPVWACEYGEDRFGVYAVFEVKGVEQRVRWIRPGSFSMGSPAEDKERFDWEMDPHPVALTEGFWIAETPCTQELWHAVTGENPSQFSGPKRPVENVSWKDCARFFETLNQGVPGLNAKLPTEAQWEYMCRAGSTQSRHGELDEIAWYGENSGG
ncbi:MAG: SUMF1/EgtB/PvdO family nonheme iron enzyme, partial [Planctomycetota bacterium]